MFRVVAKEISDAEFSHKTTLYTAQNDQRRKVLLPTEELWLLSKVQSPQTKYKPTMIRMDP